VLKKQMATATAERTQILALRQAPSSGAIALPTSEGVSAPLTATSAVAPSTLRHGDPNAKLPGSPLAHVLPCQQSKMGVYTVNGAEPAAMVFTPDPQYDLYTFQGCHFGSSPGQLTLIGHFKGYKVALTVVDWTDTSIIAAMDPGVTGEPDENGVVTLIMSRADGQRLQFDGNSFYAVRASGVVKAIPQAWATLGVVRDVSHSTVTPNYMLGSDYESVLVQRQSGDRFNGGQDYYDLTRVNPQFSVDSMLLYSQVPLCNSVSGGSTRYIDGTTTAQWDALGNILVMLGGTTCHYTNGVDEAFETYNLVLNVTGPRGVDPTQPL
jgi:hypothetical protein